MCFKLQLFIIHLNCNVKCAKETKIKSVVLDEVSDDQLTVEYLKDLTPTQPI